MYIYERDSIDPCARDKNTTVLGNCEQIILP